MATLPISMLVFLLALVVAVVVVSLGFWLLHARKLRRDSQQFVIQPPHDAPTNSGRLRPDQPGFAAAVVASVEVVGVEDTANAFAISPKRVRHLRVLAGKEEKSCASCEHWDLEEGQKFLRENPIVRAVSGALSPDQLGAKSGENRQRWGDFGACLHHRVGMGANDWCGREIHKARFEKAGGDNWK